MPHCSAQWSISYQDANAQFADADFPTDQYGYVATVDSGGACVLQTTDAGLSWTKRYIPGWSFLHKIAMADSVRGYLIRGGAPVQILWTTDGFQTFVSHNLDSSFTVEALELLNDSTGLYLNNGGRLRKFKQRGASYIYLADTLFAGQNLQMVAPQRGFWDTGTGLLKTTDAGTTWQSTIGNLGFSCLKFLFANTVHAYFSDGQHVLVTQDGGATFPLQTAFANVYDFGCAGSQRCIAANDSGNVIITLDGGASWQYEQTGINWIVTEPYRVAVTPSGDVYMYGATCGEIRKRQDALTALPRERVLQTLSVYPNPLRTVATVALPEAMQEAQAVLQNSLGQEVQRLQFSGNTFQLMRQNLSAGMYLLSIFQDGATIARTKLHVVEAE